MNAKNFTLPIWKQVYAVDNALKWWKKRDNLFVDVCWRPSGIDKVGDLFLAPLRRVRIAFWNRLRSKLRDPDGLLVSVNDILPGKFQTSRSNPKTKTTTISHTPETYGSQTTALPPSQNISQNLQTTPDFNKKNKTWSDLHITLKLLCFGSLIPMNTYKIHVWRCSHELRKPGARHRVPRRGWGAQAARGKLRQHLRPQFQGSGDAQVRLNA